MSAKLPKDHCSICDKASPSSREYCDHLKYGMTRYSKEHGKFAYARNPDPTFFDYSAVTNRADRIAVDLQTMLSDDAEMKKAASADLPFSDILAEREGVTLIGVCAGCADPAMQSWLQKLAAVEAYRNAVLHAPGSVSHDERFDFVKYAACRASSPWAITDEDLDAMRLIEPDVLFRKLARIMSPLTLPAFYAYITSGTIKEAMADPVLSVPDELAMDRMFADLSGAESDGELELIFKAASEVKEGIEASPIDLQRSLRQVALRCEITKSASQRIRILSLQLDDIEKRASVTDPAVVTRARNVARAYAMYKVAFCEAAASIHGPDVLDDPALLLLVSQHKS